MLIERIICVCFEITPLFYNNDSYISDRHIQTSESHLVFGNIFEKLSELSQQQCTCNMEQRFRYLRIGK